MQYCRAMSFYALFSKPAPLGRPMDLTTGRCGARLCVLLLFFLYKTNKQTTGPWQSSNVSITGCGNFHKSNPTTAFLKDG